MDEFIEEEREEVNDPLENEGEDAHNDAEEANDDEVVNDETGVKEEEFEEEALEEVKQEEIEDVKDEDVEEMKEEDVEEVEQDGQTEALRGGDQVYLGTDWLAQGQALRAVQTVPAKASIRQARLLWDEVYVEGVHPRGRHLRAGGTCLEDL